LNLLLVFAAEPSEKSVEIMRKFSEQYARRSGTYFCVDKGVTSVVIKVLLISIGAYWNFRWTCVDMKIVINCLTIEVACVFLLVDYELVNVNILRFNA